MGIDSPCLILFCFAFCLFIPGQESTQLTSNSNLENTEGIEMRAATCIKTGVGCDDDIPCCKKGESPGRCLFGKCGYCLKFGKTCKYDKVNDNREFCCNDDETKKGVACQASTTSSTGKCAEDPCQTGEGFYKGNRDIPGFIGPRTPRCNSDFKDQKGKFDYYCQGNETCTACLTYGSKCTDTILQCCNYLTCDDMPGKTVGTCIEDVKYCSPPRFICTKVKKCCDEGYECFKPKGKKDSYCVIVDRSDPKNPKANFEGLKKDPCDTPLMFGERYCQEKGA